MEKAPAFDVWNRYWLEMIQRQLTGSAVVEARGRYATGGVVAFLAKLNTR